MTDLELYMQLSEIMTKEMDFVKKFHTSDHYESKLEQFNEGYIKGIQVTLAEAMKLIDNNLVKIEANSIIEKYRD